MSKKHDAVRALILRLSKEKGVSLKEMSEAAGKNHAYLQQFVTRDSPRDLPEDVRAVVASMLGIDEQILAPAGRMLARPEVKYARPGEAFEAIPIFDIRASAGPGSFAEDGEPIGWQPYRAQELARLSHAETSQLAVIRVSGDSMEPMLNNADQVLVDRTVRRVGRDGIYIIDLDGDLLVKRCQVDLETRHIIVKSDNPAYETMRVTDTSRINVLGRVIWIGRALG